VRHVADTLGALRRWSALGRTVIAVLHDLDAALAAADRIAVLAGGQVVFDRPVAGIDLQKVGSIFDVSLAAAQVARKGRALVVDYEAPG
jgi:ABC-type cobalamin/Fe3+-siderophores transport system ATPase subunit